MFYRLITPSNHSSFFLFGARGTGKSTFIKDQFLQNKQTHRIDLLDSKIEDRYARNPSLIESDLLALDYKKLDFIFIDEVQKVPRLLDSVHRLIEDKKLKFILTGSSARKLKKDLANLLAGRAFVYSLFPLTQKELGESFKLNTVLHFGSLPHVYDFDSDSDREDFLQAYALTYLNEEIRLEQIVRNLDPFRNFLEVAAQSNGKIINWSNIANDVNVDYKTVQNYFQILEDTLLGFYLSAFHHYVRKAQKQHPKFYFFDPGVCRALARILDARITPNSSGYGEAFEHWVVLEFYRWNIYTKKNFKLSYWMSKEGREIDLILHKPNQPLILIEIKSTDRVDEKEVKNLHSLSKEFEEKSNLYYLSRDPQPQNHFGVHCLPWNQGIEKIFFSCS